MNGLMDTLHTRMDLKLIFGETFKRRHFTNRKMAIYHNRNGTDIKQRFNSNK